MNKDKTILVAKMYTGEFIEKNIGHEIINFLSQIIKIAIMDI